MPATSTVDVSLSIFGIFAKQLSFYRPHFWSDFVVRFLIFYSPIDNNREKQWRHGHGRGGCFESSGCVDRGGCVGISLFEGRVTAASCHCSCSEGKQNRAERPSRFSGEVLIII